MKEIPLSGKAGCGKFIIVDNEDYELINYCRWYNTPAGYPINNYSQKVHRLIMNPPKGMEVDHINKNILDNRRCNLRVCTKAQNAWNRKKNIITSKYSKYKGVTWDKSRNRWRVLIMANGKKYVIGRFDNEIDAAISYDNAARIHHGEFAYINFPKYDLRGVSLK